MIIDATTSSPLELAHYFLALGFAVIPVPRPRPGVPKGQVGDGKVPLIAWREYQRRLPTVTEIDRWFGAAPMNLAIVTGPVSGICVIDADDTDALRWCVRRLPYTPWQTRTSRGFHLWYRHPDAPVGNRSRIQTTDGRLRIDVRADGGFVIAPGSVHATGAVYRFAGDWSVPRDEVRYFWPGWVRRPQTPTPPRPSISRPTGPLLERARRYLAAIPRPVIGCGSDVAVLTAACRLVRGFALSDVDAEDLLWEWCGHREGWTREWVARKIAHAHRYGSEPVGGLVS
jgi:hypothetical protein